MRIIIGSTQKMGTGANVQRRLKAEHHLDVPWLPSDIEQREGRIERQGNSYEDVEIYAYATLGSMDAPMWGNNERKARFIAAALSGDRSIRAIDDIGETANQFALAKAIASGDARLMQKAGLEGEVARLSRQRAAHFDDQLAVRRQLSNAEADRDQALRRIGHIRQDLERRIPTRGETFFLQAEDRRIDNRRTAGALLVSKVRLMEQAKKQTDITLGTTGGFDLVCSGGPAWGRSHEAILFMERTGLRQEIPIEEDLTPLGLIARIEHILEQMPQNLQEQERRAEEAARRMAAFQDRLGLAFPLQTELDDKLAQLKVLEADLAATASLPKAA